MLFYNHKVRSTTDLKIVTARGCMANSATFKIYDLNLVVYIFDVSMHNYLAAHKLLPMNRKPQTHSSHGNLQTNIQFTQLHDGAVQITVITDARRIPL